jgi:hypothetical protein
MGSKLNRAWHEKHPMPPKATLEVRAAWHQEHAEQCGCRGIPRTVAEFLEGKGAAPAPGRRPKSHSGK